MPLGKSLDNILGDYFGENQVNLTTQEATSEPDINQSNIYEIPIQAIKLNPYQTRTSFETQRIESLADHIAQQGLINPIVVVKKRVSDSKNPVYILLAGERRLRAVKMLGRDQILAHVKIENKLNEKEQALLSAMENLQQEGLGPLDLAKTFKMLMLTQGLDEAEISQMLGFSSKQYVRNYVRLLSLEKEVQEALNKKLLTEGQARHLVPLDRDLQLIFLPIILDGNLTVKEIINLIKSNKEKTQKDNPKVALPKHSLPKSLTDQVQTLATNLPLEKTKVKFSGDTQKGKITIVWG